mmetsp:Transcript_88769/g.162722  ORF Transcript_88769/g.162722 Transcript_88769/m.162722 type:complete len:93 (+) Transcript_88769:42-320(+)
MAGNPFCNLFKKGFHCSSCAWSAKDIAEGKECKYVNPDVMMKASCSIWEVLSEVWGSSFFPSPLACEVVQMSSIALWASSHLILYFLEEEIS